MRKPPKSRKKKRRKKSPDASEESTPPGGRALQRIRQQHAARGLEEPEIAGLNLEDETSNGDGDTSKGKIETNMPGVSRKKAKRKKAKTSKRKKKRKKSKKSKHKSQ